ncbi:hypothetical protein AK812_SmicGene8044 [Symbiodinium microadriaticum]|uniref:Uncharacterized protein n=1 Tax=Symbiodinium microadriaticum TaxID=2951 RepID=A0A1Q9ELY7_SYMMI|nr:hypothetical protein AK812_SmicGene8044 [Symbiodinium microadriaticum]
MKTLETVCEPRCRCGLLLTFIGTLCFFAAICFTCIYVKLTPLYTAIECHQQSAALQDLKLGVPLIKPTEFDLLVEMNCSNPNPYDLSFEFTEPGSVFIGRGRTKVGETSNAKNKISHLPAEGRGPFWVHASTRINAMTLAGVFSDLMTSQGTLELRLQLRQRLMVDMTLVLGASMAIQQDFKKDCGMMIGNLGLHPTIGPLSCADNFEELSILPASAGRSDGIMRGLAEAIPVLLVIVFVAASWAPQRFDIVFVLSFDIFDQRCGRAGETRAKNLGLGVAMAVFYILGLLCYVCAARRFMRRGPSSKADTANVMQKVSMSEVSASSSESEAEGNNASRWPWA